MLTLTALVGLMAAPAVSAARPVTTSPLAGVPIVGDLADGGTFEGALTITGLTLDDAGNLLASGTLTGIATLADGTIVTEIIQTFTDIPLSMLSNGAGAACDILTLDLGPLHLDVLGLVVDLSAVDLDITAVPGPGNLLGNLLCAVAGLLDGGGPLAGIQNLLDRITGLLGGLLG
jgi:hypothetical protein